MKKLLARRNVRSIAVFGSVARDEARENSDIDVLVEFSRAPDLLDFVALQRELSRNLGRKVDLVTPNALHPMLKQRILSEAVYA